MSHQYAELPTTICMNIHCLKAFLTHETLVNIVYAFFTFGIDYCNSLLYGISYYDINRNQNFKSVLKTHLFKVAFSVNNSYRLNLVYGFYRIIILSIIILHIIYIVPFE